MFKQLIIIGFAALLSTTLRAQPTTEPDSLRNPFSSILFLNRPVDTLTINASYVGSFGELGENNVNILNSINKVYGLNIKKLSYSIAFKIDGYPQIFYMPSGDQSLFTLLSAKQNRISRLRLKCVVYRFYTLDGVINFFYIEKAMVSKSI